MINEQVTPRVFNAVHTFEKYQAGMQMMLDGAHIQTGQTPKEVIWTKNKARLYHYEPVREKRFPVPLRGVQYPGLLHGGNDERHVYGPIP